MFESPKQIEQKGPPAMVGVVVLAVALIGATAGWFFYQRSQQQTAAPPELSEEARNYLPNLPLSEDTGMEAKEDALGQTLLEITGSIRNTGDRMCELIEVNVVFRDVNGVELDRQRSWLVDRRTGPLEPGETQSFRMAFDNVHEYWNQAFPSLFISRIEFAD